MMHTMKSADGRPRAERSLLLSLLVAVILVLTGGVPGYARPLPGTMQAQPAGISAGTTLYLPLIARLPRADVSVTIRPSPSIRVTKGARLTYELRIRNYGDAAADDVHVTLPYDNAQLQVRDSDLDEDAGDFVSEVTDDSVTVTFGRVDAGEERTGQLYFLVNADLDDDTTIEMRATFEWHGAHHSGRGRTNFAPVLVGTFNNSSPFVFLAVEPEIGPRGTTFAFFTDRFLPNERVNAVLERDGQRFNVAVDLRASDMGIVELDYGSGDLQPGTYAMYLFGERSQLTAVTQFFVDPVP